MTTATSNVYYQCAIWVGVGVGQHPVLDREPVRPVRPIRTLAFHEVVEPSQGVGVFAEPGEPVLLHVIRVLEGRK